jgi:hypothetical protein
MDSPLQVLEKREGKFNHIAFDVEDIVRNSG